MQKHFIELLHYGQYKILAGVWASFYSDDLLILLFLFVGLECMDIFTRWLALSMAWFKATYPQSKCNLWIALKWMWQARKWRWIRSTGLRDGFCDKMMVYLILLALAGFVDGALSVVHIPGRILLTATVTVLSVTEACSIMENLAECNVTVIAQIKDKFLSKIGGGK